MIVPFTSVVCSFSVIDCSACPTSSSESYVGRVISTGVFSGRLILGESATADITSSYSFPACTSSTSFTEGFCTSSNDSDGSLSGVAICSVLVSATLSTTASAGLGCFTSGTTAFAGFVFGLLVVATILEFCNCIL